MIPIKLPREQKQRLIDELRHYVATELDLELGELAGENLLDHAMRALAPYVYNQALADARAKVEQQWTSLEEELYALEKRN
ncbi:DUF2164 domain-containing protein [Paenibacillus sp. IB182496]|uniref:DUF2164 domain-containing protein n=1 Tax=Paenibacillus sabuli TaxID=2772509 RepID=A0A927GT82_9BACL|nr:DUF2164 domain-containing protein [Paenibacillus sabuli]MBD2846825.1 DUF2164 domain-containing protein [Paenibacillus sabuli]